MFFANLIHSNRIELVGKCKTDLIWHIYYHKSKRKNISRNRYCIYCSLFASFDLENDISIENKMQDKTVIVFFF